MIAVVLALVLLLGACGVATLWVLDRRDQAEIERERERWRQRSLRVHQGRCPFSGRRGVGLDGVEWVMACPRCAEVFVAFDDTDMTLPEHSDDRSR